MRECKKESVLNAKFNVKEYKANENDELWFEFKDLNTINSG
jgi:hypothetical protein